MKEQLLIPGEPESGTEKQVIMVLGKNQGVEWNTERIRRTPGHLSPWSELGADGAGIAVEDGDRQAALFTIINTAGNKPLSTEEAQESEDKAGESLKPEATYMATRYQKIYPNLADKVYTQTKSWDTNTDAKETRRMIDEGKIDEDNWTLASVGFHLNRAIYLFKRVGIKVYQSIPTEELIGRRNPELAERIRKSDLYQKEQKKERTALFIQKIPFGADAITAVTKKSRGIN